MSAAKRDDEKIYELDYDRREREFWGEQEHADKSGVDNFATLYNQELDLIEDRRKAFERSNKDTSYTSRQDQAILDADAEMERMLGLTEEELIDEAIYCENCGNEVDTSMYPSRFKARKYRTCSRKCSVAMSGRYDKGDKEKEDKNEESIS